MNKKILTITAFLFLAFPAAAGPFVHIGSIDAKSDFPAVKIMVSVLSPDHRGITGLDEGNLLVYEDGYRVNYVRVRDISSADEYLYLVFSIDSSRSISRDFLTRIKSNAEKIADNATEKDRIAVYRFNDRVELLNNFTSSKTQITRSIKSVSRHGSRTLLYDAIYDSMELLGKVESSRRGVIVFTDGKDEGSSIKADDIVKRGRELGIPVYFLTVKGVKNASHLARLAKLTGGRLIYSRSSDVAGLYRMIHSRIKNTYEVNYQSIVKRDSKKHNLEVRLKYGELTDSDQSEFTAERDFLKFEFPDYIYLLLAGLIFLFLLLLVCLCFVFIRKGRERMATAKNDEIQSGMSRFSSGSYRADEIYQNELFSDDAPVETPDVMYAQAWLQKKEGSRTTGKIPIIEGEITIGSESGNYIVLDDELISLRHSRIKNIKGGFYLYDLISDTGTYLNGKKLLRPRLLHDWDEIRIGRVTFIFRGVKS